LLSGVSQPGDWKSWILYMLRAVETTANLTYDKINDLMAARDAVLRAVVTDTQMERAEQLVNHLFKCRAVSFKLIAVSFFVH